MQLNDISYLLLPARKLIIVVGPVRGKKYSSGSTYPTLVVLSDVAK